MGKQLLKLYSSIPPQVSQNVKKQILYVPLTFTGQQINRIKKELQKILDIAYPQLDVKIDYRLQNKLRNFFRIKDKIPIKTRSKMIYKWKCCGCDATYVGRSIRSSWTRWHEHLGKSPRTGNYIVKPGYSAILEHHEVTGHPLSITDFEILASSSKTSELEILEAMLTRKLDPSLTKNTPMASLLCF